jgi:hypothetical protein
MYSRVHKALFNAVFIEREDCGELAHKLISNSDGYGKDNFQRVWDNAPTILKVAVLLTAYKLLDPKVFSKELGITPATPAKRISTEHREVLQELVEKMTKEFVEFQAVMIGLDGVLEGFEDSKGCAA